MSEEKQGCAPDREQPQEDQQQIIMPFPLAGIKSIDGAESLSRAGVGFIQARRTQDAIELIARYPLAFVLLYVIAFRAWRHSGFNRHNLTAGQAFIGDFQNYGMTMRQYRTAKQHLLRYGFATFKATSRGTIATIINTRVFDINTDGADKLDDKQPTSKRQASDKQPTTNEEVKKGKKVKSKWDVAIPDCLNTPEFQAAWGKWQGYRLSLRSKPENPEEMFREQITWLSHYAVQEAIGILRSSIRNGWQGLFEPKHGSKDKPKHVPESNHIQESIKVPTL